MSQSPLKKPRSSVMEAKLDSLVKFYCSILGDTSPGSLHSSRIALRVKENLDCQIFLATGRSLYHCTVSCQKQSTHSQGLGGIHLPANSSEATLAEPLGLRLPGEVQSLSRAKAEGACICVADSYGQGLIQCFDTSGAQEGRPLELPAHSILESGWSGIEAWSQAGEMHSGVTSHFGSCLSVFQNESLVRRVGTLDRPNAIAAVHGSQNPLIALAEGVQVSLWDARTSEGRGCVSRMTPGGAELPLYAIAADSSGTCIAAGGAESTAFVFDVRKGGQPFDRWPGCTKHDIVGLEFPASRSDFLLAAGADQNVRCGLISSRARKSALSAGKSGSQQHSRGQRGEGGVSFRGDSRWLGFARDNDKDVVACLTASSSLIIGGFSFSDAV